MRKEFIMALAVMSFAACVDDTYDLDKDIDTSVTIGGNNITTPPIEVEPITLDNILDLDEDSNVKALSAADAAQYGLAAGDYVFMPEKSDGSTSNVNVKKVELTTTNMAGHYEIEEFEVQESWLGVLDEYNHPVAIPKTGFSIDFATSNITGELRQLDALSVDEVVEIRFTMHQAENCSLTYTKGFELSLPKALEFDADASKTLGGFMAYQYDAQKHAIVFNEDYHVGIDQPVKLKLTSLVMGGDNFRFTAGGGSHGNYADNGSIEGVLNFSVEGNVLVGCTKAGRLSPVLDFEAKTEGKVELLSITGIVDPDVNITVNPLNVTGVPSCLDDEETDLAITNPMIFITIDNPTGLAVDLGKIYFSSNKGGKDSGSAQTADITLQPGKNKLLISPRDIASADWRHIACADLSEIIRRIPDNVYVEIPDARVAQTVQKVVLDRHYDVTTDYDIVAPLALNEGSQIRYVETLDGLQDDLEDIDEIGSVTAVMDYTNTIPMFMEVPNDEIQVLNAKGQQINDVSASVEGSVKSGSIANPATGTVKVNIALKDGGKLSNFDGLKLVFKAKTDAGASGKILNEAQTLTINKAQLTISGGVTLEF